MTSTLTFPRDFLFGSATAAYQIEGAVHEDGRGDCIWGPFSATAGKVVEGHTGAVACDHYHRMPEDVALMRSLDLGAYRFSVSWARVCPDGRTVNQQGLDFYSRLVDELLGAGIRPWVTLYHWDLPQALEEQGGWPDRGVVDRFVDYALAVHDRLGDRVRQLTTLNEPWCSAFLGYAAGVHAPGRTEPSAALRAAHHLLLSHGRAVSALRERDPDLELGLTLNFTEMQPQDPDSAADRDAVRRLDGLANRFFVEPITRGAYPQDVIEDLGELWPQDLVRDGDLEEISTPIDVLGVNFYTSTMVTGAEPQDAARAALQARTYDGPSPNVGSEHVVTVRRGLPVSDMGWEIRPAALHELLLRLQRDYTGPAGTRLYVTENGAAMPDVPDADGFVDDQDRIAYLDGHLRAVHAAIEDGADVRGYFVWSLLDNYEWAFGYTKRFGIVRVDYDTQRRTPKASARWYADVAGSGSIG
ncbi:Beta-glucosidase [Serinicoccus hydrothermalis]|uniref:Beta-glucosidase n=1 Tax=Serinicoccus hydrothermalis TaxID=1758689 RepID=A0A1B1N9T4_9MICO|nr:GH1 family beta-glucosidase [Serinicoccus hydrothermalis]ANS78171.1 Beta-glucosidase [Serinicoccus hydrothermalis]